MEYSAGPATT